MDWKPAFTVTVDGQDITSLLASRLSAIRLTDEAGVQSDAVEILLSDHMRFARLAIPPTGAEIEVALGYTFRQKAMGLFIADSIEVSGPPDQMRIRGTAAVHGETSGGKTALNAQKSRSWPAGTTIAALVRTIAGEHGLEPAVSESLASIALPHLDQIDESDINLLTRVAREHDAIAKPGGGKLIVAQRGESLTVTGNPMPRVALGPSDVSRWRWEHSLRPPAGQVVAVWHDPVSAEDVEVTAGDSEPVRRLRQRFPSEAAARAAAEAEFRRAERAGTQLSIALPGNPDLVAEGRVVLAGFRPDVDGDWLVRRVTHILDRGGYRCDVEAEVPE